MGLEAYLFDVDFDEPVPEQDIIGLFIKTGMSHLLNKFEKRTIVNYGSYYFELRTDYGLIEAHCLLAPEDTALKDFSLRFSIVSPNTVIDQTFDFLKRLHKIKAIRVYDTEIRNHIYRLLRKEGKVDDDFNGLEGTPEEKKIEKLCQLDIDAEEFMKNKPGIMKRQIVIENTGGEIIEGGAQTIDYLEKNRLVDRFIGWIREEL